MAAAEITPGEQVLEVGPGIGTLTEALLGQGARVIAVEIDAKLREVLKETVGGKGDLTVVAGDAMDLRLGDDQRPGQLVANLPYNISSPLMIDYFLDFSFLNRMIVMIQREVADRILAVKGNKSYGAFTVKCRYLAIPSLVCNVSRKSFLPPPNVDSAVIRLERRTPPLPEEKTASFFSLVDAAFSGRRKMIRNSLRQGIDAGIEIPLHVDEALASAGFTGKERAEQLSLDEFLALYHALHAS